MKTPKRIPCGYKNKYENELWNKYEMNHELSLILFQHKMLEVAT
jgi:hypothetical protein